MKRHRDVNSVSLPPFFFSLVLTRFFSLSFSLASVSVPKDNILTRRSKGEAIEKRSRCHLPFESEEPESELESEPEPEPESESEGHWRLRNVT